MLAQEEKKKGKYTKPEPVQPKAYKQELILDSVNEKKLRLLSRIMAHLWNKGVDQAESWLEQKAREKKKPEAERMNIPSVTAFSFNMWLKNLRDSGATVKLTDSREFKLSDVSIDVSRQTLRRVADGVSAYFEARKKGDTEVQKPKPTNPDWFQTLSWSSQNLRLENGMLYVPCFPCEDQLAIPIRRAPKETHGDNRSRPSNYLERMIAENKVRYVNITYRWRENKYLISFVIGLPITPPKAEVPSFYRAIALGSENIAVTDSNGEQFLVSIPQVIKYRNEQVASIKKRQETRKDSKKLKRALQHQFERCSNQLETFQRKLAHALVGNNIHCVVVGRRKIRLGLAQSDKLSPEQHSVVQSTGNFFRLMLFIRQKCKQRGVRFLELPDLQQEEELENPDRKLCASRQLLAEALEETNKVLMPTHFVRKNFLFKQ